MYRPTLVILCYLSEFRSSVKMSTDGFLRFSEFMSKLFNEYTSHIQYILITYILYNILCIDQDCILALIK